MQIIGVVEAVFGQGLLDTQIFRAKFVRRVQRDVQPAEGAKGKAVEGDFHG